MKVYQLTFQLSCAHGSYILLIVEDRDMMVHQTCPLAEQGWISEVCPSEFYTHCQAHLLNLSAVKGCSVLQICSASGTTSEIAKICNNSPK